MADLIGRHIKAVTLHEKSENASFAEKLKNRVETLSESQPSAKTKGS